MKIDSIFQVVNFDKTTSELTIKIHSQVAPIITGLVDNVNKKYNGFIRCQFSPPYKPRTTGKASQNHRINGFLMQICEETGNDFDDLKMYCKKRAIRRGYPVKVDGQGYPIISLETGEYIPESERNIDTLQASYLIEEIEQLASEYGIILTE